MFSKKRLLITGGTGSFGMAVLERLLETDVSEIRVFSRDEKKQDDMRKQFQSERVTFHIGDVRSADSLAAAMTGMDFVFHAAALKQVPSCEFFPLEAVKTNVLGTENVLNAAIDAGVKKVICLSTDKAVYPINAMGISKAMMEKLVVAKARQTRDTVVCATRYGNVMASRGSVIPLFVEQIKSRQPMTITDPAMTRFLMSIREAVDLVIFAFQHATPGDIFVQKASASTIGDLAVALQELFEVDRAIRTIGTRHGEKLFETLVTREEMARAVDLGDYYKISADNRDLNYDKYYVSGSERISQAEEYTSHNTRRLSISELKDTLLQLDFVQVQLESWRYLREAASTDHRF